MYFFTEPPFTFLLRSGPPGFFVFRCILFDAARMPDAVKFTGKIILVRSGYFISMYSFGARFVAMVQTVATNCGLSPSIVARQQMQRLAFLDSIKQEYAANHYRPYTGPNRDVDRLLVLYRQLDLSQLGRLGVLGVAETAIPQPQDADHNQHYSRNLDCVHFVSSY